MNCVKRSSIASGRRDWATMELPAIPGGLCMLPHNLDTMLLPVPSLYERQKKHSRNGQRE